MLKVKITLALETDSLVLSYALAAPLISFKISQKNLARIGLTIINQLLV